MDKPNYTPLHPTKQALSGNGNGNGHHAQTFDPAAWQMQAESLVLSLPDPLRKPITDAIAQAMRAHLRDEKPRQRFVIHSAAEALQPQPPIDWIVERVISAGSVNLVVGEAKSKKTFSMIDQAACIARRKPWLEFQTCGGPVLIIDEESGERRLNRRIGDTLRAHGAGDDTPLYYVTLANVNLLDLGDCLAIEDLITETKARAVYIDALIDVLGDADENAAAQVQQAFHALRTIAEHTQAAIIVIHHNGKNGSYRGSSAMRGAVDLLLTVESKPDSPNIDFKLEAPRDVEPFSFAAVANFGIDTFNLSPSEPQATLPHFTKGEAYVLRYLAAHSGQATLSDIAAHADTVSDKTAMNSARNLAAKGYVKRIDAGGQGDRAVYALTERGREFAG